jgi:hypothetical protein
VACCPVPQRPQNQPGGLTESAARARIALAPAPEAVVDGPGHIIGPRGLRALRGGNPRRPIPAASTALTGSRADRWHRAGWVNPVAQRSKQRTHNPLVPGSNPGGPTNIAKNLRHFPPLAVFFIVGTFVETLIHLCAHPTLNWRPGPSRIRRAAPAALTCAWCATFGNVRSL